MSCICVGAENVCHCYDLPPFPGDGGGVLLYYSGIALRDVIFISMCKQTTISSLKSELITCMLSAHAQDNYALDSLQRL